MRRVVAAVSLVAASALTAVPCSVKDVANGVRDGLQAALRARQSRLTVELPPGAPLALRGGEDDGFGWFKKPATETAKVVKGDRALADFVSLLFPDDFAVASVYASSEAAEAAAASTKSKSRGAISALPADGAAVPVGGAKKSRKKSRSKPTSAAAGFGAPSKAAPAAKKLWCPALGVADRAEIILVVGALDAGRAATVDAVADSLGDDVAICLLNSRRDGAAARPGNPAPLGDDWVPAFALSPPPPPASGAAAAEDLVASFTFPGPWAVGKPKLLGGGADVLWTGDARPTPENVDAALAAVDDPLAKAKAMFSR